MDEKICCDKNNSICKKKKACICDDFNRWIEMSRYYQDPTDGDD